ncbi:hypothetical protein JF546_05045 [Nitratireductor aquimarinus]|uniref:hypothetical protein n=1 Tax=Nitratireductor aquimarinus TaxID=889300 RepID=UPI001A8DC3EC|nr:hypothetical protein [Nitratireductor aquimarinus]MBN8242370.1 hypothetical protein [Nitratireductor aquimarinus]MBY6130757.1 hypothetical protein [Nitratireductor aquimarinus]MCA1302487.1 hypothetical protein [Nitratireductor aquimarinus]
MAKTVFPAVSFERSIICGNLGQARLILREWLLSLAADDKAKSIADALSVLVRSSDCPREVPIVLIRALSVDDLLPEPNTSNQLERIIVALCEQITKDICDFVGINPKSQTYEKFKKLQNAHASVQSILEPFSDLYGDLPSIVAARKRLLGVMNHSVVRAYCKPFGLQEFKSTIEVLFSDLSRLADMQPSFLLDLSNGERTMEDFDQLLNDNTSFLGSSYFRPFHISVARCLSSFLAAVRSKYTATIRKAWPAEAGIAKRYPLHEVERRFNLTLPFRNEGNGTATDVVVTAVSGDDAIEFENPTLRLGGGEARRFLSYLRNSSQAAM